MVDAMAGFFNRKKSPEEQPTDRPAPPPEAGKAEAVPALEAASLGQRSQQEQKTLLEKISLVARVFSSSYDLDVIPSGGGWACTVSNETLGAVNDYLQGKRQRLDDLPPEAFRAKTLLYDANDLLQKSEDIILGVTRHEVAHMLHTDFRLFFEGQRLAEIGGYLPTTWATMHNALEDVWINIKECADSEVVRSQMMKLYEHHFPEVLEKINTQPPILQLGLNTNYYWLHGKNIPTLTDKRVLAAMQKIQPHVDQYFWGESPQANYENLRNNIWPVCRELEEAGQESEALKELSRRLSGGKLGGRSDQGAPSPNGDKSISGKLGRALERIKRGLGMKGQGEQGDEQFNEDLKRALNGRLDPKAGEELGRELERQQRNLESTDKTLSEHGETSGKLASDIDLDAMPEHLKEALRKAASQLPAGLKRELQKRSQQNLDKKQAEALSKDSPKSLSAVQDPESGKHRVTFKKPPSEKEIKKAKEAVRQAEEEVRRKEQAGGAEAAEQKPEDGKDDKGKKELRDMAEDGFAENERELYGKFRELETDVNSQTNSLIGKLSGSIPKIEERIYSGEHYNGNRLNRKALSKHLPVGDLRVYAKPDYVPTELAKMYVELLIDNSGSMAGEKMDSAQRAAIALSRMAKHFGMPLAIKTFDDGVTEVMNFNQDYDDPRQKIKPKLLKLTNAGGGATNLSEPLRRAREEMLEGRRRFPGSLGAVFVISDSGANVGTTGSGLIKLISEMQKEVVVVNFVLSDYDFDIKTAVAYFGEKNVVAPKSFDELPQAAGKILASLFERFMKRYGEGS